MSGVVTTAAETRTAPAPLMIQVGELMREAEFITVSPRTALDGQLKPTVQVTFFFQSKTKAEVEALFNDALQSKRAVRIVIGTNLITECSIGGLATLHKGEKDFRYGLSVGFGGVAQAEHAAEAMREDIDVRMRRRIEDRRSWRI
jgi:hypothetical protein